MASLTRAKVDVMDNQVKRKRKQAQARKKRRRALKRTRVDDEE